MWRLLPYNAGSSRRHFRQSDALVRLVTRPTLWWHSSTSTTLIIGPTQREVAADLTHTCRDVEVVQRDAGGTALLATPSLLGLDIALPRSHYLCTADVLNSYRWLGEVWVEALAMLTIKSRTVSVSEARLVDPPPDELCEGISAACFGTLSPWEVVIGDRKVVGFSQVRRQPGMLLQSGIYLSFDAHALANVLLPHMKEELARELKNRAIGLDECATSTPSVETVQAAFTSALESQLNVTLQKGQWTSEEEDYSAENSSSQT